MATLINLNSVDDASELIKGFYPKNLIPAKVKFGVEEIIENLLIKRLESQPEINY